MQDENYYKELETLAKEKGIEIYKISAVTKEGINNLFNKVSERLKELPKEELVTKDERVIYELEDEKELFVVTKENNEFNVEGSAIDRVTSRVNLNDNESLYYFFRVLKDLGVEKELKKQGIKEGDIVRFKEWEFEWYE